MELVSIPYVYLTWVVFVSNGVEGVTPVKEGGDATSLPQLLNAVSSLLQYYQTNYVSTSVEGVLALRVIEGQLNILVEEYKAGKHRYVPADVMVEIKSLADGAARITNQTLPHLRDQVSLNSGALMKLLLRPWSVYHPHRIVDPALRWDSSHVLKPQVFSQAQSRQCIADIINHKKTLGGQCGISKTCLDWMTQPGHRGHVLQQQIYYLTLSELVSCKETVDSYLSTFGEVHDTFTLLHSFCTNAYYELEESVRLYGLKGEFTDLFLQTEFLCPSLGFFQFLQLDWLDEILTWQDTSGCFVRPKLASTTTGQQQSLFSKKEENIVAPFLQQRTTVHSQKYQQGVGKPVINSDQTNVLENRALLYGTAMHAANNTWQRANMVQLTGFKNQMNQQHLRNIPVPPPKFIQSTNQGMFRQAAPNIGKETFTKSPLGSSPTDFGRNYVVMSPEEAGNYARNDAVIPAQFKQYANGLNAGKISSNQRISNFEMPQQVNNKIASNSGRRAVVNSAYNLPAHHHNQVITQSAYYSQSNQHIGEHKDINSLQNNQYSQLNKNYNNNYNQNQLQNNIQNHRNLDYNYPYAHQHLQPNEDFNHNIVNNEEAYPAHQYMQPREAEFHQPYQYNGYNDQHLQGHYNQHAAMPVSNHQPQQRQKPHHIETREVNEYNMLPSFDEDTKRYENHREIQQKPRDYEKQPPFEHYQKHYEDNRQFQSDPKDYGNPPQFHNTNDNGRHGQFEKRDPSPWKNRWLLSVNLNKSPVFVTDLQKSEKPSYTYSTINRDKDTRKLKTENKLQKFKSRQTFKSEKTSISKDQFTKNKDNIKSNQIANEHIQIEPENVDKLYFTSTENINTKEMISLHKLNSNVTLTLEISNGNNTKRPQHLSSALDVGQAVTNRTVLSIGRRLLVVKDDSSAVCDSVVTSLAADVLTMYIRYMVNHGPSEFQSLGLLAQQQAASKLEIRNQPPPYNHQEYHKPMVHEGYPQYHNAPVYRPPDNSGHSYIVPAYRPLQKPNNNVHTYGAPTYRPLQRPRNNLPNVPVNYHSQIDHHAKVLQNLREVAKIPPYRAGSYYIQPKYSMSDPGQGKPSYYPPSPEETIRKADEFKELPDRAMYDIHMHQHATTTRANLESHQAAAPPQKLIIHQKTIRNNRKSGKLSTEFPDAVYIGGSAEDIKAMNNMISIQQKLQADLGQYMTAITVLSLLCLFLFLKYTRCRKISFRHRTKFI